MESLKSYKTIGQELYYRSEQDMINIREWYNNNENEPSGTFCFAEDGESDCSLELCNIIEGKDGFDEDDFFCHYYSNYCDCVYEWLDNESASFDDVMEYNKLWWNESKCSINVFTPYYTKEMIIKENPYSDFYKRLNQHTVTTNSQIYLKEELSTCHPSFLKQRKIKELKGVLALTVQRPYMDMICSSKDAEKLCEIDDDNLLIGFGSARDNKWYFNSTFRRYCDVSEKLCVTKVIFPFVGKVENTTHVYYGSDDASGVYDYISSNKMGNLVDYDDLTTVFVVYRHWDNDVHLDPMEYMFRKVVGCFDG